MLPDLTELARDTIGVYSSVGTGGMGGTVGLDVVVVPNIMEVRRPRVASAMDPWSSSTLGRGCVGGGGGEFWRREEKVWL